jgi:hypothetical protein
MLGGSPSRTCHRCLYLHRPLPRRPRRTRLKLSFFTKSQLLFIFAAPDTQGLRLKDTHLLTLRSFDKGLWQSTTDS